MAPPAGNFGSRRRTKEGERETEIAVYFRLVTSQRSIRRPIATATVLGDRSQFANFPT